MKLFPPLREWLSILGGSSRYGMAGAGFAGALAVCVSLCPKLTANPFLVFLFAFPVPPAILYLWDSSDRSFRARLEYLKKLADDKLIGKGEYDTYRKMALRWYGERRFGRVGVELPGELPESRPPPPN